MSNKAFTKTNKIILDDNWSINPDADNGVVLEFTEIRQKENKEGVLEDFNFIDKWYFPKVSQALERYVKITANTTSTIEEILENSKKTYDIIDKIAKEFKQFN